MNKNDLVEHIASCAGITKAQARRALDCMAEGVVVGLRRGERVSLPGFGTFAVSERAARYGRNPSTGEAMEIQASRGVRFKASLSLKQAVNE